MAASHLFRLGTVKNVYNNQGKLTQHGLLALLKHHKRTEAPKENVDASKSKFNYSLTAPATPESITAHANEEMFKAGIVTPRKNGVIAVEVLFSLPIDQHNQDTRPFFNDCYEWVKLNFAGELLSFDVHLDESAPHAHALILPLVNGKMQGNAMMGNKGNLKRLDNLFFNQVAVRHGLSKPDYKQLNAKDKQTLAREVSKRLNGDSVKKSAIWAWVRDAILADPLPLAEMLGVEIAPSQGKQKHFVNIKRSRGKGSFER